MHNVQTPEKALKRAETELGQFSLLVCLLVWRRGHHGVRWRGGGVEVEGAVCYAWGSEQLVIAFAFFTATACDLTT